MAPVFIKQCAVRKQLEITADGRISTGNYSLNHDFYGDENVKGTGAALGLCPMFRV